MILITKNITEKQKEILSPALEYQVLETIAIRLLSLPKDFTIEQEWVIFTSQNAVQAVFQSGQNITQKILCVGEKTAEMIQKYWKIEPSYVAQQAEELAEYSVTQKITNILFFSGNIRKDTLVENFKRYHVDYKEVTIYQTELLYPIVNITPTALVFFSPSAVDSFFKNNSIPQNTPIFVIGKTTAEQVQSYGYQSIIAPKSTVESLLHLVNDYSF